MWLLMSPDNYYRLVHRRHWTTPKYQLSGRAQYGQISLPVTLVCGDQDWSRPAERKANAHDIPGGHTVTRQATGHFASLENPKSSPA